MLTTKRLLVIGNEFEVETVIPGITYALSTKMKNVIDTYKGRNVMEG